MVVSLQAVNRSNRSNRSSSSIAAAISLLILIITFSFPLPSLSSSVLTVVTTPSAPKRRLRGRWTEEEEFRQRQRQRRQRKQRFHNQELLQLQQDQQEDEITNTTIAVIPLPQCYALLSLVDREIPLNYINKNEYTKFVEDLSEYYYENNDSNNNNNNLFESESFDELDILLQNNFNELCTPITTTYGSYSCLINIFGVRQSQTPTDDQELFLQSVCYDTYNTVVLVIENDDSNNGGTKNSTRPSTSPSLRPTLQSQTTPNPSSTLSTTPSFPPTSIPTTTSAFPTLSLSSSPTFVPTEQITTIKTESPTESGSEQPSSIVVSTPSSSPTFVPTEQITTINTESPTESGSEQPSSIVVSTSSHYPSKAPSLSPSFISKTSLPPSNRPSNDPSSKESSNEPSHEPSIRPSQSPSIEPTILQTIEPSIKPSFEPTIRITPTPTIIIISQVPTTIQSSPPPSPPPLFSGILKIHTPFVISNTNGLSASDLSESDLTELTSAYSNTVTNVVAATQSDFTGRRRRRIATIRQGHDDDDHDSNDHKYNYHNNSNRHLLVALDRGSVVITNIVDSECPTTTTTVPSQSLCQDALAEYNVFVSSEIENDVLTRLETDTYVAINDGTLQQELTSINKDNPITIEENALGQVPTSTPTNPITSAPTQEEGGNVGIIVGVSAGSIIVLASIVGYFMWSQRRGGANSQKTAFATKKDDDDDDSSLIGYMESGQEKPTRHAGVTERSSSREKEVDYDDEDDHCFTLTDEEQDTLNQVKKSNLTNYADPFADEECENTRNGSVLTSAIWDDSRNTTIETKTTSNNAANSNDERSRQSPIVSNSDDSMTSSEIWDDGTPVVREVWDDGTPAIKTMTTAAAATTTAAAAVAKTTDNNAADNERNRLSPLSNDSSNTSIAPYTFEDSSDRTSSDRTASDRTSSDRTASDRGLGGNDDHHDAEGIDNYSGGGHCDNENSSTLNTCYSKEDEIDQLKSQIDEKLSLLLRSDDTLAKTIDTKINEIRCIDGRERNGYSQPDAAETTINRQYNNKNMSTNNFNDSGSGSGSDDFGSSVYTEEESNIASEPETPLAEDDESKEMATSYASGISQGDDNFDVIYDDKRLCPDTSSDVSANIEIENRIMPADRSGGNTPSDSVDTGGGKSNELAAAVGAVVGVGVVAGAVAVAKGDKNDEDSNFSENDTDDESKPTHVEEDNPSAPANECNIEIDNRIVPADRSDGNTPSVSLDTSEDKNDWATAGVLAGAGVVAGAVALASRRDKNDKDSDVSENDKDDGSKSKHVKQDNPSAPANELDVGLASKPPHGPMDIGDDVKTPVAGTGPVAIAASRNGDCDVFDKEKDSRSNLDHAVVGAGVVAGTVAATRGNNDEHSNVSEKERDNESESGGYIEQDNDDYLPSSYGANSMLLDSDMTSGDDDTLKYSTEEDEDYTGSGTGTDTSCCDSSANTELTEERMTKRVQYRNEVEDLVREVVPTEVDNVDVMMEQFRGREDELVSTLRTMKKKKEDEEYTGSGSGSGSGTDTSGCDSSTNTELTEERITKRAQYHAEVEDLVREVIPREVDNVDVMMEQFSGREDELVNTLKTMKERAVLQRARLAVHKSDKRPTRRTDRSSPASLSRGISEESYSSAESTAGSVVIAAASVPRANGSGCPPVNVSMLNSMTRLQSQNFSRDSKMVDPTRERQIDHRLRYLMRGMEGTDGEDDDTTSDDSEEDTGSEDVSTSDDDSEAEGDYDHRSKLFVEQFY